MIPLHYSDPDVRELVRAMRDDGCKDAIGDHHDWEFVTWDMVRHRLEEVFGNEFIS